MALFLFLIASASKCFANSTKPTAQALNGKYYSKVALGIAGQGPGTGIFGHTFIVFYDSALKLSESEAFSFSLVDESLPEDTLGYVGTALKFLGYGKDFIVERQNGLQTITRYSKENRIVVLYELKFNSQQQILLRTKLLAEKASREEKVKKDYSFISKNCLTEALRMIEEVRLQSSPVQIPLVLKDILRSVQSIFAVGLNISNAPMVGAARFHSNSLVAGVHIIPPKFIRNAPLYAEMLHAFTTIGKHLGAEAEYTALSTRILGREKLVYQTGFLDFIIEACKRRPSPEILHVCSRLLENLYLATEQTEQQMLIEGYEDKLRR